MNYKMKRWVSLFLAIAMVLTAVSVPTTVNAETTTYATSADNVDPDLFVEEDFDYVNGSLSKLNGGYGWGNAWWVRNDHTDGY